jgi:methylglutaconyl-CoA hydratase
MTAVRVETSGPVARIVLDRPQVRNAFDDATIRGLHAAFAAPPAGARVVVLSGAGPSFCAGADIEWMRRSRTYTEEENRRDAAAMAAMFRAIDECPLPVVGRIHGHALGGGAGLTACCDVAVAAQGTRFGFTEVRLGIIPAVISTFVLPRIAPGAARRWFLTGERFDAARALEIGLVHEAVPEDALDPRIDEIVGGFLQCGPAAVAAAKKLLRDLAGRPRDEAIDVTVETIARLRVSPEAQEGLSAFLEKRKPGWA